MKTPILHSISLILAVFIIFGCSKKNSPDQAPNEKQDKKPASQTDFSLAFDSDFYSSVNQIVPLKSGGFLFSGIRRATVDNKPSAFLRKLEVDKTLSLNLPFGDNSEIISIVPHKDESFSVLDLKEIDDSSLSELSFSRYQQSGGLLAKISLKSLLPDLQLENPDCQPTFVIGWNISTFPLEDGIGVLANICFQYVAFALNKDHKVLWSKKISSPLPSEDFYFRSLATTDITTKDITLFFDLKDKDLIALATTNNISTVGIDPAKYALVLRLNSTNGEIKNHSFVPMEPNERAFKILASENLIYTVGVSAKANSNGRSTNVNDLLIKSFDLTNSSMVWEKTYSFRYEHVPWTAIFGTRGEILVGGSFGHVVVNSGSWAEYPDGFVAAIDPKDGDLIGQETIHSDRSTRVFALSPFDKDILISGEENGPITHSADNDRNQGYGTGFLRRMKFLSSVKNTHYR